MNPSKLFRHLVALAGCVLASAAFAQTASLKADATALSPAGGTVKFTATVAYTGAPGALGWELNAPADWTLVSVDGPQAPQIAAPAGATGKLEFAYTRAPGGGATFSVVVSYPAGAASAKITPKVFIRENGKLTTLEPAAVELKKP